MSLPCGQAAAHCGRPCGKKLKCGLHSCKKLCHRPGECQDFGLQGKICDQVCGKTKLFCEHPCQNKCHGQTPCNGSPACTAKATVCCPCGLRQQEVKCLASSSNPTPARPEIKCDEECLRLERNRRLAAALNIDPSSHANDHVPYSDTTLRLFKENLAWAETQEREFRVFAKSANEVRMRYKPMSSTYRQFLHALAEDYGLESKGEDVEPHRYAVVYKGSRFVSAPSKTLAQCIKIRDAQATEAMAAAAASRPPSPPSGPVHDPLNSLLLTSVRFDLTVEDVKGALGGDLASQPSIHFAISFLPTEEILMRATASYSAFLSPAAMEQALVNLKPRLAKTVERTGVAGNVLLCHVDSSEHISRREDTGKKDGAGWSAVAGRAAAKLESARAAEEAPAKSGGRKLLGLRRKKVDKEQGKAWDALGGDVEC
ncbi:r3H domain-containing protein [Hirsutella rhossiliensis]|uniref:R3H domain-containing protein n=1 Tax=Hirsutella rhossiliensis TaxID=111463 RepID=A0A9P8MW95_9HYPO|nr:r3H domain-containing protein [Hirsutella rhossiliensis]KAH0963253.1 r3H domain-containing protein [Hirsutella rhossiliensis]